MEPRIQYANTSDGVNIAYWTLGVGTPVPLAALLDDHAINEALGDQKRRRWFTRLAATM